MTSARNDTEFVMNVVSRVALAIDCDGVRTGEPTSRNKAIQQTLILESVRLLEASWSVMAYAQKPDFVFRRNGRVHLNRRGGGGRQFSRLLAAEMCASAVVTLDTPCSEVVWRVLATQSIRQFPFHFPSRPSPCAITFQLESTTFTRYYLWSFTHTHTHKACRYASFIVRDQVSNS